MQAHLQSDIIHVFIIREYRMPPVITVENPRKTYGNTIVVDDFSFRVSEGGISGPPGPNGAGKTSTVECLQGPRQPGPVSAGTVRLR